MRGAQDGRALGVAFDLLELDQTSKGCEMTYFVEGLTKVHGGEGNVRRIGEYEVLGDAISASEQVIDEFLMSRVEDGMTIADLFFQYERFGEVPFIFCNDASSINVSEFNHFKYAIERCSAICLHTESELAA